MFSKSSAVLAVPSLTLAEHLPWLYSTLAALMLYCMKIYNCFSPTHICVCIYKHFSIPVNACVCLQNQMIWRVSSKLKTDDLVGHVVCDEAESIRSSILIHRLSHSIGSPLVALSLRSAPTNHLTKLKGMTVDPSLLLSDCVGPSSSPHPFNW